MERKIPSWIKVPGPGRYRNLSTNGTLTVVGYDQTSQSVICKNRRSSNTIPYRVFQEWYAKADDTVASS